MTAVRDWREQGLCLQASPDLFFPIGTTGPADLQVEEAKAVCARCPVQATCLNFAMVNGIDHGVWGGHSEEERRALKRRSARTRTNAQ